MTALLTALLLFLAGLAVVRKAGSLARGWTDAHVPVVVEPGAYESVASDLDSAVTAAGLEVNARAAGAAMSTPARWLAAVAGSEPGALVPDQMIELRGADRRPRMDWDSTRVDPETDPLVQLAQMLDLSLSELPNYLLALRLMHRRVEPLGLDVDGYERRPQDRDGALSDCHFGLTARPNR